MMRKPIGYLLLLHGLAHALAGMQAADYATASRPVVALATLLWAVASVGFVSAGFVVLGVPAFGSLRGSRVLHAGIPAVASLLLLILFRPSGALVGAVLDLALVGVLWRIEGSTKEPAAAEQRPGHRWGRRLASAGAVLLVAYLALVILARPWHMRWGSTNDELRALLPGDQLVEGPVTYQIQHAVTVHAPADSVWPWLAQLGQDRGGFYSYARLENLFGLGLHNADRIHPEWQQIAAGDTVFATPPGWLGMDHRLGWTVSMAEPGRVLVLDNWGAFVLEPAGPGTTRLIVRTRGSGEHAWWEAALAPFGMLLFEPAHFIMERKMLLEVKERAEAPGPVFTHRFKLMVNSQQSIRQWSMIGFLIGWPLTN